MSMEQTPSHSPPGNEPYSRYGSVTDPPTMTLIGHERTLSARPSESQMKASFRLFLIVLLAPALAHLTAAPLAPMLVLTAVLSYPLSVLVAGIAVPSLHAFLVRRPSRAARQFALAAPMGAFLGVVVYAVLFWAAAWSGVLVAWYAAFGLLNSVLCWSLYNWGPLNVSRDAHLVYNATPR